MLFSQWSFWPCKVFFFLNYYQNISIIKIVNHTKHAQKNTNLKVIWNDILTILSYIREWVHKCLFNKTDIVFWIFYAKCERHSRSKLLNREKEHWLTRLTSLAYDVSKTQSPYKAMLWIQISMSFCSILKEKKYYSI